MAEYRNPYQWNDQAVSWDPNAPKQSPWDVTFEQVNPGYASGLLSLRARVESGRASEQERQDYAQQEAAARAIPMRDPSTLKLGWSNDEVGSWDEGGSDWWAMLNGSSPDLGNVLLSIADRMDQGTATPQERDLLKQTMAYDQDWNYRASVPQASDAFNPLGDQFFSALGVLGLGATGGLAAAPLFAGGAGLASTLGSLGTLSGIAGTGAGVLGQATDQEWLQKLGMGLGAAGGIAGGVGGLANLWGTGINSLGDAARLASNAGRVVGGVGSIADNDILKQAGGWLGTAGQLGSGVNTVADVFGGGVNDLTDLARLAQGAGQVTGAVGRVTGNRPLQQASGILGMGSRLGGVQGLLGAAGQAQRGGRPQGTQPGQHAPLRNEDWLRWTGQPGPWQEPQSTLWNL